MRNPQEECPPTDCPTCHADAETLTQCFKCGYDSVCNTCGYCTNPDCIVWDAFTRRTNEPKLSWIERELDKIHIPHRRNGESWHAPILQVPKSLLDRAWTILPQDIDDMPDDHSKFLLREKG